jgi:lysophospholipase L1-like esterase
MPRIYPARSYGVSNETNAFRTTKGVTNNNAKTQALTWTDQISSRVASGPTSSAYPVFNFLGPGNKLGWNFNGIANNMSLDAGFLGQFVSLQGITWQAKIRPGDYPNGTAETYFFFLSDGGTSNGSVGRFAVGPVGNNAANQIVITGRRLDGGTRFVDYVGTGANTGSFWTTGEEFVLTVTADYTGSASNFGDGSKVVYSVWKDERLIYRQNVSTFNAGSNDTTTAPAKVGAATTPYAGTLGGSVANSKYAKGVIGDWNVWPFLISDSEIISKVSAIKRDSQMGTIQITSPQHGQAFQKGANGTQNIAISGTYTGNPTSISASFKGGTPQVIVASPSGGTFSGTLTAQTAGQGELKVYFTNDTNNYCIRRKVLISDVFALVGQSNNTDATDTNFGIAGPKTYSMPATMGPTVFNSRYNYANWNDTTLCQNFIVGLGQAYYNKNGYPCAFIYAAIGGTNIDKWQPGNTNALYGNVDGSIPNNNNPQSGGDTFGLGTNLYNRSVAMINQACPTGIRALLWHQGEADAGGGVSTATYNTKLTAIANAYATAFPSAKFLPVNLQIIRTTGNSVINSSLIMTARAQVVAAGLSNVLDGPDFSDLECDFQSGTGYFHLLNDTAMAQVSSRWFAVVDALPAYVDPSPYPLAAGTFIAAYSMRQLSSSYNGPAITAQRVSDSATQDIGFVGRNLDTASLLSFASGGTVTIKTWYDQTGNGWDATQTTAAAQPIIVNAGTITLLNGSKPCSTEDGTRWLTTGNINRVQPFTFFVAANPTSSNPNSPAGTMVGSSSTSNPMSFSYSGSAQVYKFNAGTSLTNVGGSGNGVPKVVTATGDYHAGRLEVNPNYSKGLSNNNPLANLEIGSAQGGQFKFFGGIAEVFVYGPISQTRKDTISSEMHTYYGLNFQSWNNPAWTKGYVFTGDSLTFGQNASNIATDDWPSQYVNSKITAGTYFMMNTGVPGAKLSDMSNKATTEAGLKNYVYPNVPMTLWIMGGTNDIINNAQTASQTYNSLKAYLTACLATGKFNQLGILTIPPSGASSGAFASTIKAYNDLIRAGGQPGGDLLALGTAVTPNVTVVIGNLQSDAAFDDTVANVATVTTNATNYNTTDRTHLTTVGYGKIATVAAAALQ